MRHTLQTSERSFCVAALRTYIAATSAPSSIPFHESPSESCINRCHCASSRQGPKQAARAALERDATQQSKATATPRRTPKRPINVAFVGARTNSYESQMRNVFIHQNFMTLKCAWATTSSDGHGSVLCKSRRIMCPPCCLLGEQPR